LSVGELQVDVEGIDGRDVEQDTAGFEVEGGRRDEMPSKFGDTDSY
jgi:hypothetical protein